MQNLRSLVPWRGTLSQPEYIPTRLMQFFYMLYDKFPNHKLISSDFHKLGDTVEGLNAPVVQTRYKRQMIPVTTPLVSCTNRSVIRSNANTSDRSTKGISTSSFPRTSKSWSPCTLQSPVASHALIYMKTLWRVEPTSLRRLQRTETTRY
jgi:hypothetical protein